MDAMLVYQLVLHQDSWFMDDSSSIHMVVSINGGTLAIIHF